MTLMNKLWLRSKTIWFGLSVVVLAVAELAQEHLPVLLADAAPKTSAWTTLAIGVLIIVLRRVTYTGVHFAARPVGLIGRSGNGS